MTDEIKGNPNCPDCLHPLEAVGSIQHPYWRCPSCGRTAISA